MNKDIALKTFARNLGDLIRIKGYSQREYSKHMDYSPASIGQYTSGRQFPRADRLIEICEDLETTPDRLFGYPIPKKK
jgi:transcriptional regulator with XRE-family HTH domain